jgi:hypothetical protein
VDWLNLLIAWPLQEQSERGNRMVEFIDHAERLQIHSFFKGAEQMGDLSERWLGRETACEQAFLHLFDGRVSEVGLVFIQQEESIRVVRHG